MADRGRRHFCRQTKGLKYAEGDKKVEAERKQRRQKRRVRVDDVERESLDTSSGASPGRQETGQDAK